jgi:hypothetical protein
MLKTVHLDHDLSMIATADHRVNEASAIATKMYHENNKFPKTYVPENTRIHQLWWTQEQLDFESISKKLGMTVCTVSSIILPPGSVIPLHQDTFHKLRTQFPDHPGRMVRAVVYATEYDMGQFTQYLNDGRIHNSTDWKIGDGTIWDDQVPHVTVNGSMKDLCTVNFSGFLQDKEIAVYPVIF